MFGSNKNKKSLYAVASGKLLPLSAVPDEAFASGLLGDGYAIDPTEGIVYSPVAGKVAQVTEGLHAYTIESEDGLDILVHIGIDTVELHGAPFSPKVAAGDRVAVGDVLAHVDLAKIRGAGYSPIIPVLIANVGEVASYRLAEGTMEGGKTVAMTYHTQKGET